jgi:glycosyltransferase involved in cell wall biosynthesis
MKKLSIIIPCYNEKETILEILKRVSESAIPGWTKEIIIVDDASTDGTRDLLTSVSKLPPAGITGVKVFFQDTNGGKGSAITRGLQEATGDYILIQDADLEYDPKEIPALINGLPEKDADGSIFNVVYGSRNLYHVKRRGFYVQRWGVWFLTKLINILYDQCLTDVWTCYKLFPAVAGKHFVAGRFEAEILFTLGLIHNGYTITEVPISHTPRSSTHGKKIRYRDGAKAILIVIMDRLLHLAKPTVRRGVFDIHTIMDILLSPETGKPLKLVQGRLTDGGESSYPLDTFGRPYLIRNAVLEQNSAEHVTGINWLKSFLKQFPRIYYTVWHIVCPVMMLRNGPRMILRYFKKTGTVKASSDTFMDKRIVNVGSGPERLGDEFINIDVYPFPEVDIVADATHLPFADGTIDAIVSESVLEHVADAHVVANDIVRVLKPGGVLYVSAPFVHPYHASPDDFNRWTVSGLKHMFRETEILETGVRSGPWSALLMFMAYWLGVIFSFGYVKAAPFIAHLFMIVLGPFKYLDYFFMMIPGSDAVATHLYIICKKK